MYSAADIKANKPIKIRKPTEGSRLRLLYDFLIKHKFEPLSYKELSAYGSRHNNGLTQLRDFYDMEIVSLGHNKTIFVGFFDHNGKLI